MANGLTLSRTHNKLLTAADGKTMQEIAAIARLNDGAVEQGLLTLWRLGLVEVDGNLWRRTAYGDEIHEQG